MSSGIILLQRPYISCSSPLLLILRREITAAAVALFVFGLNIPTADSPLISGHFYARGVEKFFHILHVFEQKQLYFRVQPLVITSQPKLFILVFTVGRCSFRYMSILSNLELIRFCEQWDQN